MTRVSDIDYQGGFEAGLECGVRAVMDLFFGLRECGGEPTLRDLVLLAKRIRKTADGEGEE